MRVPVHTSQGKCPINNHSQQYLALSILGSRLNAMNAPFFILQPSIVNLLKIAWNKWNYENLTSQNFLCKLFLMWKLPTLSLDITMTSQWHHYYLVLGKVRGLEYYFCDAQLVLLMWQHNFLSNSNVGGDETWVAERSKKWIKKSSGWNITTMHWSYLGSHLRNLPHNYPMEGEEEEGVSRDKGRWMEVILVNKRCHFMQKKNDVITCSWG